MNQIQIFDSLTHPSISGLWYENSKVEVFDNTIESLVNSMDLYNICSAFAVSMGGLDSNNLIDEYIGLFKDVSVDLRPVAFICAEHLSSKSEIDHVIALIKAKGYYGIKIHPRKASIGFDMPLMSYLINKAHENQLISFLCTYFGPCYSDTASFSVASLAKLLFKTEGSKIVLLHGGGAYLLQVSELVRAYPNTILDLSFTMSKYKGSSLEIDIKYLFKTFDQRICIGSDSPEFSHKTLRNLFNHYSEGVELKKLTNIANQNLQKFCLF